MKVRVIWSRGQALGKMKEMERSGGGIPKTRPPESSSSTQIALPGTGSHWVAGGIVEMRGWGEPVDGEWVASRASHSISGTGIRHAAVGRDADGLARNRHHDGYWRGRPFCY